VKHQQGHRTAAAAAGLRFSHRSVVCSCRRLPPLRPRCHPSNGAAGCAVAEAVATLACSLLAPHAPPFVTAPPHLLQARSEAQAVKRRANMERTMGAADDGVVPMERLGDAYQR